MLIRFKSAILIIRNELKLTLENSSQQTPLTIIYWEKNHESACKNNLKFFYIRRNGC